jgi:hypothetical protein
MIDMVEEKKGCGVPDDRDIQSMSMHIAGMALARAAHSESTRGDSITFSNRGPRSAAAHSSAGEILQIYTDCTRPEVTC